MSLDPVTGPDALWWRTSRRRVFLDTHTPDWTDPHQRGGIATPDFPVLSAVDPGRDLDLIADAGADSVVLFAKCQYGNAYYPTAIGRPHAALRGRDLFGEQLAAAHARGLRVIAYYSNMWDVAAVGERPDWALEPLTARGSTGRWPALCLRSRYRVRALDQVREIAQRYPIDGLWSDILTAGPCVCSRCQAEFRAEYGRGMPADRREDGWLDLIHFSQRIIRDYLAEQRTVLAAERPDAALIPNFYATTFVDAVLGLTTAHLQLADIGSTEGYTDWHGLGFPSFASASIRSGMLDGPTEVLVSRFVHTWDFTLRSAAQLRFEAFTVAAHGCTVTVDDQPMATGALDPEVYRRLTPVFARVAERSPWLDGTRPVRYAALWTGQNARELESLLATAENPSVGEQSAQFPPSQRRDGQSDLVAAVTGSYRALVEAHLPVSLVDERPASLDTLGEHRVLLLPDVLALGAAEVAAIESFVRAGGGLVVTGPTGVRDGRGRVQEAESALDDLLGVRFGEATTVTYPYLRLTDDELRHEVGGPELIPHYGQIARLVELAPDVEVLARRTDPVLETRTVADNPGTVGTFWHNNQPAPGRPTEEPVIVSRAVGRGRMVVCAARLGNNHARLGHGAYRDLLAVLVRRAAGAPPPVELVGVHRTTELMLTRRGPQLVAHLVTGSPVTRLRVHGVQQPDAIEDVAAIPRLTLRLPADTTSAARVVEGHEVALTPRRSARGIEVDLHDLDDWETIVINRAER